MLGSPRLTLIQVRGAKSVALIPWRATARLTQGQAAEVHEIDNHPLTPGSSTRPARQRPAPGRTTDSAKPIFSCDPAISSGLGWLAGRTILGWMAVAIAM